MIDVKTKLRTAYFNAINGHLSYSSVNIPVSDTVAGIGAGIASYVLITNQIGRMDNTQQSLGMEEQMKIDIISTGTYVSNVLIDNIAGQILALIFPTNNTNGLPVQSGISIVNVRIIDDRYQPFRTDGAVNVSRRMITFSQLVTPNP